MVWVSVTSTNLSAVAYNPMTRVLSIRFHRSGVYHYHGVPHRVHLGLMSAGSKGKYFNAHIKDRYPFSRG